MRSSNNRVRRVLGAFAGGLLCMASAVASGDSTVTEGSKAAGLVACVAPTAEMRRYHMDYIKHDRWNTVHQGIRDGKFSLVGCVDCHASQSVGGTVIPIDSQGEFCQKCHGYTAVTIDCFHCHRSVPQEPAPGPAEQSSLAPDIEILGDHDAVRIVRSQPQLTGLPSADPQGD